MKFLIISRKNLLVGLFGVMLIAATLCVAGSGASAYISTAAAPRKIPIYCVEKSADEKMVAISFDAAWGNEDTGMLIEILADHNVKATFFVVGQWVDKYPESVKQLSDAGHEVQSHSDTHPHMTQLSPDEMVNELQSVGKKIENITGVYPTLFRAPYGDYNNSVIETVEGQNTYCIQWDVDSLDWKDLSADEITRRVCDNVKPGSIVLFHNAAKHTPEALPTILDNLQGQGYTVVPVSELIYKENYTIDNNGMQCPN